MKVKIKLTGTEAEIARFPVDEAVKAAVEAAAAAARPPGLTRGATVREFCQQAIIERLERLGYIID